jgi:hypothetical protein
MGFIINTLFIDSLLGTFFFFDDGTCESFHKLSDCTRLKSLDQINNLCTWSDSDLLCEFNKDIGNDAFAGMILVVVISMFLVPLQITFEYMIHEINVYFIVTTHVPAMHQQTDTLAGEIDHLQTLSGKKVLITSIICCVG